MVAEGGGDGQEGAPSLAATSATPVKRVLSAASVGLLAWGWLALAPDLLGGRAAAFVNAMLCMLVYVTRR